MIETQEELEELESATSGVNLRWLCENVLNMNDWDQCHDDLMEWDDCSLG